MPRQRLILVDGHSMVYRAYFAVPAHLSTKSGLHTNAIFGFTTMFRKLLAGRTPENVAVVFDAPGPTFRDEVYAEYKAGRSGMPDDLREQLPWIDRVVRAHNFPMIRHPGVEADDVIGTLAVRAVKREMDATIVSADKDFAQLIGPHVRMYDGIKDITYDYDSIEKKWGVPPEKFVDLLALLGDKLDNIPGVPGIGRKGAIELLEKYGSLEGILEHLDQLKGRQKKALEEGRESGLLSKALATIDTDVDLELTIDDLRFIPPDQDALNALFVELEFFSLLDRSAKKKVEDASQVRHRIGTSADLDAIDGTVAVAYLAEPPYVTGSFIGIAVSPTRGEAIYVPFDATLAGFFSDPGKQKITHDAKTLILLLRRHGIEIAGLVGDTQLASFAIDTAKCAPHRLDQIAKEYLQRILRPVQDLIGRGKKKAQRPSELPAEEIAEWLSHQADTILTAWPPIVERLEGAGQRALFERDLELAPVIAGMELAGVQVDGEELVRLSSEFSARIATLETEIFGLAGKEFNIGSPKQLAHVLFEELDLPAIKRNRTGYSTDSEVLERLAHKHAIARPLLEHRKLSRLISTYTNVLGEAINPITGRVHAALQMTGSSTGRLISTDPDLQKTPIKDDDGARVRRAFLAPPGHQLISADWSQIELRILAHFSEDPVLIDSFQKNADVHRRTASQLFSVAEEAVTLEQRGIAKTVNFATIYGQGSLALSQILGISKKEAESFIERYFELYAGVHAWIDRIIETARAEGAVRTLLGRKRFIPELFSRNPIDAQAGERIAVNTPIQGTAADISRITLLEVAPALTRENLDSRLLLLIHDELLLEAPAAQVERTIAIVRDRMEHAVELRVPLRVNVGAGPTWRDAH